MFAKTFTAVRSAKEWGLRAPRHTGEFVFGPAAAETVVFGVFGDSVGCGLGVECVERTFAGEVAARLAAQDRRVVCRIHAVSGARGRWLAQQPPTGDERFAAVSIGSNDVIHGESLSNLERCLSAFLDRLRHAERVVVLGPGALDSSILVPPLLKPVLQRRLRTCEGVLRRAAARFPNARHFGPADLPMRFERAHFADDGFHPSAVAHALIAKAVLERLQ